jgi:hypothetical protein
MGLNWTLVCHDIGPNLTVLDMFSIYIKVNVYVFGITIFR